MEYLTNKMVEIEKELGPLLDEFNRKKEEIKKEEQKKHEEFIARNNEFIELFTNIVWPVMIDYKKFLDEKNHSSYIETSPRIAGITFGIDDTMVRYKHRDANIKFSQENGKVRIVEEIKGISSVVDTYDKEQLTPEFVGKKLSKLIKSYLDNLN